MASLKRNAFPVGGNKGGDGKLIILYFLEKGSRVLFRPG